MENTILLIDGSSFVFRAFYAVKSLNAPNGMPTNAIYGVINMLKQLQKKYTTTKWVCVFDSKGKTFRDEIYPAYKANRRETPAELIQQLPYIHEIIRQLGICVIMQDGVEADDIIATIAQKYAQQNYRVLIATGDKDFAQIVDDKIILINTMTNEVLDRAGVEAKFGVKPEQIIDYLSLIGDSADNVPGVPKCGPKTAQKWLSEYGSIANLITHQEQLGGVVGANFRATLDWLPMAQRLITIDCAIQVSSVDINQLANLECRPANWAKLLPIYRELNFKSWLKEAERALQSDGAALAAPQLFAELEPATNQPAAVTKIAELKPLIHLDDLECLEQTITALLGSTDLSAFSLYLDDYTNRNSQLVMVSITTPATVFLIQLDENLQCDLLSASNSERVAKIAVLARYWSGNNPKICNNLKWNLHILQGVGCSLKAIVGDLSLASYLEYSQQSHEMAAIIGRYTKSTQPVGLEILLGKGAKQIKLSQLAQADLEGWILNINQFFLEAHHNIVASLSPEEQFLYREVELPLAGLLFNLELAGMLIDRLGLKKLAVKMHCRLKEIENQLHFDAKVVFNVNSPKQLQEVLFQQLQLPTSGIKKNTSGYSTDEESLNILAESGFSIATLLLEFRNLSKLLNTYIDRLPEYADHEGRVHTSLEQTVVSSGRLSSKDPNLQNIPVRSAYGQAIRECFIAKPGHKLVCADYSQIELRILAQISQDPNLIQAFKDGSDIHQITASQIFHKELSQVSKDERRYAKSINFGLIYGKSVFGLAKELKIERSSAKVYIDNYFARFPLVKEYMEQVKEYAHQHGYVKTAYGRKIHLKNINSSNNILRQAEERLALNAPMQGTAADIIKIAMLKIDGWLAEHKMAAKMILQVHDELIFEVPDEEVSLLLTNLPQLMADQNLAVPLIVEVKAAANWGAAH